MRLHHFHDPEGNFGDDLNHWLWDALLPGWRAAWPDTWLVGVGTLINDKMPAGAPKMVMGSGVGYGELPSPGLLAECRFVSVRGPRSAAALEIEPELGILDPAALIPLLPDFADIGRHGEILFIPHHRSVHRQDWPALCARAGLSYLSPCGEAKAVIRRIAGAKLVVTESMHGAILADAFGVPWHAVSINAQFNGWKWADWGESLGVAVTIHPLASALEPLIRRLKPAPKRVAASGGGGDGGRGTAGRPGTSWKGRLRLALERLSVEPKIRALAARPGQLSDRARLADAQTRLQARLAGISAEMAENAAV
ncbi:polysaccharide pyruvyl transferase family protein [Sandaracinobacter sp.]|uniref:polysaccharide pyruvyl transferase family protein n=1 Tax=Sandaracinobacter sp. TaxID=2487581 RepID=UPI0035AEAFF8